MYSRNLFKQSLAAYRKYSNRIVTGTCATVAAVELFCEKPLPPETCLHIDMDKLRLVERANTRSSMIDEDTMELKDLINVLYEASNDDELKGIVLDTGYGTRVEEMPTANLEELHRALVANKKLVISTHKEIPGLKTFYLSGTTNLSHLHTRGSFEASGITEETYFARGMMDEHRVKACVFKNGKYKSAPSFYTSNRSTNAERENTQAYLKSISQILWRDSFLCVNPSLEKRSQLAEKVQNDLVQQPDVEKDWLKKNLFNVRTVPNFHCDLLRPPRISLVQYVHRLHWNKQRALLKEKVQTWGKKFCQCMSHQASGTAYAFLDGNEDFFMPLIITWNNPSLHFPSSISTGCWTMQRPMQW